MDVSCTTKQGGLFTYAKLIMILECRTERSAIILKCNCAIRHTEAGVKDEYVVCPTVVCVRNYNDSKCSLL